MVVIVGELRFEPPPICAGDGCLESAAPGNTLCWRCIRSKSRSVRDYHAKAAKYAEKRAERLHAQMRPRLYAVALGSAVKFGITVNPKYRLSGLQVGVPDELILIGHIGCDRQLERDVHDLCVPWHLRGEWFRREGTALTIETLIADNKALEVYRLVGRRPGWLAD